MPATKAATKKAANSFSPKASTAGSKPTLFSLDQNTTLLPQKDDLGSTPEIDDFNCTIEVTSSVPTTKTTSKTTIPMKVDLYDLNANAQKSEAAVTPIQNLLELDAINTEEKTKLLLPILKGPCTLTANTSSISKEFAFTKKTVPSILNSFGLESSPEAIPSTQTIPGGFRFATTSINTSDSIISDFQTPTVLDPRVAFNELEDQLNKCSQDLEEQEHLFTEKATEISASDMVLTDNNQKILELNDAMQKVKIDQKVVEKELEFMETHRMELDKNRVKTILKLPKEELNEEHIQTSSMVENLETQLKLISVDFKEIIDCMNDDDDNMDLNVQIDTMLCAHINTLEWFEMSLGKITNKLEDIDKMYDILKRDIKGSLRMGNFH